MNDRLPGGAAAARRRRTSRISLHALARRNVELWTCASISGLSFVNPRKPRAYHRDYVLRDVAVFKDADSLFNWISEINLQYWNYFFARFFFFEFLYLVSRIFRCRFVESLNHWICLKIVALVFFFFMLEHSNFTCALCYFFHKDVGCFFLWNVNIAAHNL